MPKPQSKEWYAAIVEETIDPERPIIDAHHHLWERPARLGAYMLEAKRQETACPGEPHSAPAHALAPVFDNMDTARLSLQRGSQRGDHMAGGCAAIAAPVRSGNGGCSGR